MKRERLLTIAVVVLLVLNSAVVGYLLIGQRPGPPRPELFDLLVRELEMNSNQQQNYFRLRDQHRDQMDKLNLQFAVLLEKYLSLISDSSREERVQLEDEMAILEKQKASITFDHFNAVKQLCTPEQQEKFNKLIPEIARMMSRPRQGRPPHRE